MMLTDKNNHNSIAQYLKKSIKNDRLEIEKKINYAGVIVGFIIYGGLTLYILFALK